jgi:uncharacterized protein
MLIELDDVSYKEILHLKENPNSIDKEKENHIVLLNGRFIVESDESEINKIILTNLTQRYDNQNLSLTIAPTRACNFNCVYCYESDRPNEKMSKGVQDGIIEFVKKYKNLNSLNVTWYGGEPTLEIPTIKYLTEELKSIVDNYSAFLVTNGFLLERVIDFLEDLNINSMQITLDGTKESHNKTRSLLNGGGTFDKILLNIEKTLKKNVKISIRMNVSKENGDKYVELFKLLGENFKSSNISLYPGFVHYHNGACKADSCYDDSYSKAIFLKGLFEKHGIYSPEIYPFRSSKGCMMQRFNSFLIGPNGDLYKCWHFLGNEEEKIGNILNENIFSNYDLLANTMLKHDILLDKQCHECILFPSCNGGCSNFRSLGENVCIPAKSSLEDFIEIHYKTKIFMQEQENTEPVNN